VRAPARVKSAHGALKVEQGEGTDESLFYVFALLVTHRKHYGCAGKGGNEFWYPRWLSG